MNILITGGASGLGEAITKRLAGNVANAVWFTYYKSVANAEALAQAFPNAKGIQCDYGSSSDVARLLKKIEELEVEVLVNNAIATPIAKKHFHKMEIEAFRDGFMRNIIPIIEITQKAIVGFREKKNGKIITVLSATLVGKPPIGYSEYTATKAYMHSLAKSWANENAAFGITSNCVSPSYMATHLTSDTDERIVEDMVNRHPLKRLLAPAEVAMAVEFLADASPQINGVNLVINAGTEML
jgi:3-oxoacyl-[acyl-carrier protein] reductase